MYKCPIWVKKLVIMFYSYKVRFPTRILYSNAYISRNVPAFLGYGVNKHDSVGKGEGGGGSVGVTELL